MMLATGGAGDWTRRRRTGLTRLNATRRRRHVRLLIVRGRLLLIPVGRRTLRRRQADGDRVIVVLLVLARHEIDDEARPEQDVHPEPSAEALLPPELHRLKARQIDLHVRGTIGIEVD